MSPENAQKQLTDDLTRAVLDIDSDRLSKLARLLARRMKLDDIEPKIKVVVTGPSGSGKSTIAPLLAKELGVPSFDLDEDIDGGFTSNLEEYGQRLLVAWNKLWSKLPMKTGWVIEHVEACNPHALMMFRPSWALILKPNVQHLKLVAEVRDAISGDEDSIRQRRAMDTAIRSTKAFENAPGVLILSGKGWELKRLIKES